MTDNTDIPKEGNDGDNKQPPTLPNYIIMWEGSPFGIFAVSNRIEDVGEILRSFPELHLVVYEATKLGLEQLGKHLN